MRSLIAMLLLMLSSLPTFASLTSLHRNSEANLPACCRRLGAHHCGMAGQQIAPSAGAAVAAKLLPCPFTPHGMPAAQHSAAAPALSKGICAQVVSHPAGTAQTLAKYRVARDRSRQKRGPPIVA